MLHDSGLPIPRFVTLKSDLINFRVGPGRDYPISWVYRRKGLPVEVVQEFGHWRKLRDKDGMEGWVHGQLVSGERRAIIEASGEFSLLPIYLAPSNSSKLVMEAQVGAIVHLLGCEPEWCEVESETDGLSGWIEKRHLWGAYANEVFED